VARLMAIQMSFHFAPQSDGSSPDGTYHRVPSTSRDSPSTAKAIAPKIA
jgi:hypothetical protein